MSRPIDRTDTAPLRQAPPPPPPPPPKPRHPKDERQSTGELPHSQGRRLQDALKHLNGSSPSNQPPGAHGINPEQYSTGNQPRDVHPSGITAEQVKAAYAKLPPDQQQKYDDVKKAIDPSDAATLGQLQGLLVGGQLASKDTKGGTLLDNLDQEATGKPSIGGFDNQQLVTETLHDLSNPASVNQGGMNTCVSTIVQAELAQRNPAEYSRLMAGLGTGSGKVRLQNGTQLDVRGQGDVSGFPWKYPTITAGLMAPAFMNVEAQNQHGHYVAKDDAIEGLHEGGFLWFGGDNNGKQVGATDDDVAHLEDGVFGGHFNVSERSDGFLGIGGTSSGDLMNKLKSASVDHPVMAAITVDQGGGDIGGHEVQVVGYDVSKKKVSIRNPWGEVDEIPADKFQQYLNGVVTP